MSKVCINDTHETLYVIIRLKNRNGVKDLLLTPSRNNWHFGIFNKPVEKFYVLTSFKKENRSLVFGTYKNNFIGYFFDCLLHNVRFSLHRASSTMRSLRS